MGLCPPFDSLGRLRLCLLPHSSSRHINTGMAFFTFSSRAIVGVLAALSCAAAQSFPNAQSISVNTTGKLSPDSAVTLKHLTPIAFCRLRLQKLQTEKQCYVQVRTWAFSTGAPELRYETLRQSALCVHLMLSFDKLWALHLPVDLAQGLGASPALCPG